MRSAGTVVRISPGTAGIQYTGLGAAAGWANYFYLAGAVNACGESAPW